MVRYKPSQFTKRELEAMVTALVPAAGLDFLTGGALNKYTRAGAIKIAQTVARLAIPPVSLGGRLAGQAALGTARVLGSSAVGAALPIVTNPYVAGAALGYGALQTQPGQQLLEAAAQSGADTRRSLDMALFNIQALGEEKVKRTKSKFNVAVSKGMKAVKDSTSYGKKGIINAPKKAFKTVVKVASTVNKLVKAKKKPKMPKGKIESRIFKSIIGTLIR
jgi:hypothetical protein